MKRAQRKNAKFYWSPSRANLHCEFIECLHHVEGTWSTPTITLIPAQIFFVCQLFGFRNHLGGRRFSSALLLIGRKNAKSTLAAAILLSCLCLEYEEGPQIISAATTGDQARKVFDPAKRMVEKSSELREVYGLEAFSKAIARYENGGSFKPINAKASTQDGLNPSHTVMDEVHAHKNADLLNVLTSAAGARANALWLYTTTEGYENPGPWGELRAFSQNILQGVIEADHFLAVMYALDEASESLGIKKDDDEFDESTWVKANPLLETNKTLLLAIRKEAIEAKGMPSKLAEFRIKRCNRRSSSSKGCINLHRFRQCGAEVDLNRLVGAPCWGAYDGASTTDMASWRLLWKFEDMWWTWGRYWVPREAVKQRSERKSVNYQGWADSGLLTVTEGDVNDEALIEAQIIEDFKRFGPLSVGYDPWNAGRLAQNLMANGVPMLQFIQGAKSYNPGWQAFESAYTSRKLCHGGNKVLIWNASNLIDRRDANMNFAPDKKRSPDKIDGMCTLLMNFAMASNVDTSKSFWE